jgi:hypothetical protein
MREGAFWWFDNKQLHEASNDGDEDRLHLIFDVLPGLHAAIERRERALRRAAVDRSATAESAP